MLYIHICINAVCILYIWLYMCLTPGLIGVHLRISYDAWHQFRIRKPNVKSSPSFRQTFSVRTPKRLLPRTWIWGPYHSCWIIYIYTRTHTHTNNQRDSLLEDTISRTAICEDTGMQELMQEMVTSCARSFLIVTGQKSKVSKTPGWSIPLILKVSSNRGTPNHPSPSTVLVRKQAWWLGLPPFQETSIWIQPHHAPSPVSAGATNFSPRTCGETKHMFWIVQLDVRDKQQPHPRIRVCIYN